MPAWALELCCTSGAPLWRRACASLTCRLQRRIALARFGVAHMRRAHTRHWRLWLARALAPCSSAAPRCAGSRSGSSTRFARLRRRASRGVDSASALRLACGAPRGRPPGSLRLCTARGRRFGGAPLAPRPRGSRVGVFAPPAPSAAFAAGEKNHCNKSSRLQRRIFFIARASDSL